VVSEFGGAEQLRLAETADPVPGPGQVRVVVHAAGVNPVDAGNRADGSWAGLTAPFIPATTSPVSSTASGPGSAAWPPGTASWQ
jgi:NADPH:quinone reductase-like Zn-dependent oxidoreductase